MQEIHVGKMEVYYYIVFFKSGTSQKMLAECMLHCIEMLSKHR